MYTFYFLYSSRFKTQYAGKILWCCFVVQLKSLFLYSTSMFIWNKSAHILSKWLTMFVPSSSSSSRNGNNNNYITTMTTKLQKQSNNNHHQKKKCVCVPSCFIYYLKEDNCTSVGMRVVCWVLLNEWEALFVFTHSHKQSFCVFHCISCGFSPFNLGAYHHHKWKIKIF